MIFFQGIIHSDKGFSSVATISRRSFLQLSTACVPALAGWPDRTAGSLSWALGRVAVKTVDVRREPDGESPPVLTLKKDTLFQILRTVEAEGPAGNPRWLQVEEGFIHSGDVQPVSYQPQIPVLAVADVTPAEVSVPITQSYRTIKDTEEILYRLYYQSVHWVKGIQFGERNRIWYILHDQQLGLEYYAPGEHLRLLPPEKYSPLHPEVEPWKKRIEISLAAQELTAYEDKEAVRTAKVSAGMPGKSTATPTGSFNIQIKIPGVHMGDGRITTDPLAYELPGVPWVGYFELTKGVALHGAYWHNDFGRARSHGCINLRPEDALWLYRWNNPPAAEARIKGTGGYGTRVIIR
jgi:hypothetical protein